MFDIILLVLVLVVASAACYNLVLHNRRIRKMAQQISNLETRLQSLNAGLSDALPQGSSKKLRRRGIVKALKRLQATVGVMVATK